jgi:adenylate kinase family enzyme
MKIAIIGYSGCGKSTLARRLGQLYKADVLHLDSVHFLPDWAERETADEQRIVEEFLDTHDAWVIDGNYTKLSYERRLEEADRIVVMLFGRFDCLRRVTKRYAAYKNKTRPDMADGCCEKLDAEFVTWVLWRGRQKARRGRFEAVLHRYPEKTVVLRNQKELDAFADGLEKAEMDGSQ